jgi:hypothetical protein
VRLGPSGTSYCIVQTSEGVCCLDPVSGAIRWQRRDIPPDGGLYAHEEAGIFGDARQIVIMEPDQRRCRIVSTETGDLVTTSEVPTNDVRRSRLVFGSRLFLISDDDGQPRVRLWDAATQTTLVDEPAHMPVRHYRVDRRHVAYVSANGEVVVLDTRAAAPVLRHPLEPEALTNLTGVFVWNDLQNWYVHTSHSGLPTAGGRTESIASDIQLPSVTINGILSAYRRADALPLWSRPFESRTLLLEPQRRIPFLVTLWRQREGLSAPSAGLTVELLDKRSGLVVAQAANVERTRYVHSAFRPSEGEYEICGESARIQIRYELPPAGPIVTAENAAGPVEP